MLPNHFTQTQSGIGRLGTLVFILIVVSGVYFSWQVLPYYYNYYEIEGLMQSQADKASVFSDNEIRRSIMERIKKLNIPFEDEGELKINRFDGKIVIEFSYEEPLYVDFGEDRYYELYVFQFNPRAEQSVK